MSLFRLCLTLLSAKPGVQKFPSASWLRFFVRTLLHQLLPATLREPHKNLRPRLLFLFPLGLRQEVFLFFGLSSASNGWMASNQEGEETSLGESTSSTFCSELASENNDFAAFYIIQVEFSISEKSSIVIIRFRC